MSYCINPDCEERSNLPDAKFCARCGTSLLIEGRFQVLDAIGIEDRSHPWEVFKVRDTQDPDSGKFKVLKTLKKYLSRDEEENKELKKLEELFEREKEALKKLETYSATPNYILDFELPGEEGTRPILDCLVMELIDGQDLGKWLDTNKKLSDRAVAISWLREITNILAYLHSKQYVHRDIKPGNIILKKNKELALVDFGSVQEITGASKLVARTRIYSEAYAAPEQIKNGSQFYLQSDFFALGKTFVHLLTGKTPNRGSISEEWQYEAKLRGTGIAALINWLLKENHLQRPQTAEAILQVIDYISTRTEKGISTSDVDAENFIHSIQQSTPPNPSNPPNPPNGENQTIKIAPTTRPKEIWKSIAILTGVTCLLLIAWIIYNNILNPNPRVPSHERQKNSSPAQTVEELISFGDRSIGKNQLKENDRQLMEKGIQYFSQGHYKKAYDRFYQLRRLAEAEQNLPVRDRQHDAVRKYPNLLIYMNNARVRYWHHVKNPNSKIYTIVAALPLDNGERGKQMLYGVAHAQSVATLPVDSQRGKIFYGETNDRNQETSLNLTENNIEKEPIIYLEIGIANDLQDPQKAKEIAEKLGEESVTGLDRQNRTILAVVGHYTSEVTCEALPAYSASRLPIISPTSTLKSLRSRCGDNNKVFFRTVSSTEYESKGFTKYLSKPLIKQKISNLKIISFHKQDNRGTNTKEFSQDLFNIFKKDLTNPTGGVNRRLDYEFNMSDPRSFQSGLDKITQGDQNTIVLLPDGRNNPRSTFEQAVGVLKKARPEKTKLIIASNPLLTTLPENLLKKWKGSLIGAVDWHGLQLRTDSNISCGSKKFIDEMSNLWGGDLNRTTAQSYEAVQVLSNIVKSGSNTRAEILTKLKIENNIISDVFKLSKFISFDDNEGGNRQHISQRILITPDPNGTRFIPIDNNQCH